jgi:CheY-like chemotaxis protein
MLRTLSVHECLRRATGAERRALQITEPTLRAEYLRLAEAWSFLARNYECVDSLECSPSITVAQTSLLIVEDDSAFADSASRHLQSLRYTTAVVSGAQAAIRELDRQLVDIVVANLLVNEGDPHGVALRRLVRNSNPNLPVVLVTAHPRGRPLPSPVFNTTVDLVVLAHAAGATRNRC